MREIGSAQGKGAGGPGPQTGSEISSLTPAKEGGNMEQEEEGMMKRTQHAQSEHCQRTLINVLKCY
jgi:hypothetical protein